MCQNCKFFVEPGLKVKWTVLLYLNKTLAAIKQVPDDNFLFQQDSNSPAHYARNIVQLLQFLFPELQSRVIEIEEINEQLVGNPPKL